MHVTISSKSLKNALAKVAAIPATGEVDQIIEISATLEGLSIAKQTNVARMSAIADCDIDEEGGLFMNAEQLTGFTGRVEGDITMQTDKAGKLVLTCEGMRLALPPLVGVINEIREPEPGIKTWKMPARKLLDIVEVTHPFMAKEKGREKMMGLIMENVAGVVYCSGMDGRKFALYRTQATNQIAEMIPLGAIAAIHRILSATEQDAEIELGVGERSIIFKTPSTEFICSLYGEKSPSMAPLVNGLGPVVSKIRLPRARFSDAVSAASAYGYLGQVEIRFSGGKLNVGVESSTMDFNAEFDVEIEGEDGEHTVNGMYLRDMLNLRKSQDIDLLVFDKPTVMLAFVDSTLFAGVLTIRRASQ